MNDSVSEIHLICCKWVWRSISKRSTFSSPASVAAGRWSVLLRSNFDGSKRTVSSALLRRSVNRCGVSIEICQESVRSKLVTGLKLPRLPKRTLQRPSSSLRVDIDLCLETVLADYGEAFPVTRLSTNSKTVPPVRTAGLTGIVVLTMYLFCHWKSPNSQTPILLITAPLNHYF